MNIRKLVVRASLIGSVFLTGKTFAQTTNIWTQTAGGARNWTDGANWSGGLAPSPISGDTVDFSTVNIANDTTLSLQADRTAEIWKFGDTDNNKNWIVATGNKMILAGTTPTIQVNTSGRSATINCILDGTAGLKKDGEGALSLDPNKTGIVNTFTGPIVLNGGALYAVSLNTIGSGGDITFTGSTWINPPHSITTTFAKSVTVNPGVTATFYMISQFYNMSFTGPLAGSGTVYLLGPGGGSNGSLAFNSDSNTFTGKLEISSQGNGSVPLTVKSLPDSANPIKFTGTSWPGDFVLGSGTATPLLFNSRQIELGGTTQGANIRNNNATATNTITINTDVLISGTGNKILTLGGSSTGNNTFGGAITNGTGSVISLTKADAGKWILTGTNTYSGATTVSAGTLVIGASSAMTSSASLYLPSAATKNITMDANATVTRLFLGGVQQPNGTYTSSGAGSAWMNTGSGTLTVGPTEVQPLFWDINDSTEGAGGTSPGGTWDAANIWNTLYDGKGSVGAWTAGRTAAFAAGTDATGTYTVSVDGTQDIGGLTFEEGTVTLSGGTALRLVSDAVAFVAASRTATVVTAISEYLTPRTLNKLGTGTLVLSGNNDYTGATTVGAGTLTLSNADAISASSGLTVQGGLVNLASDVSLQALNVVSGSVGTPLSGSGKLDFIGTKTITVNGVDATIQGGITGSPTLNISGLASFSLSPTASATMTLGTLNMLNTYDANKSLIFGGESTNVVNKVTWTVTNKQLFFQKKGTGTWTIESNMTLDDGKIFVEDGMLIMAGAANTNSHSINIGRTSGNVSTGKGKFMSGGTFTIMDTREHFIVYTGATLAPGVGGIGTITIGWTGTNDDTAKLNMNTGSIYEWEVGPNNTTDTVRIRKLTAKAATLLTGNITLKVLDAGGKPKATDQMPVFTYDAGVTRTLGAVTIDTTALKGGWTGTPTLVDNGTGTIYLTGLQSPVSGTVIQLK